MLPRRSHTPGTPPPGNGRAWRQPLPQPGLQLVQTPNPTAGDQGGAPAPLLVDAREAARLLAVSARTLWTLTDSGALPCVRIGRLVRYRPTDLAAWVAAQIAASRPSGEARHG